MHSHNQTKPVKTKLIKQKTPAITIYCVAVKHPLQMSQRGVAGQWSLHGILQRHLATHAPSQEAARKSYSQHGDDKGAERSEGCVASTSSTHLKQIAGMLRS